MTSIIGIHPYRILCIFMVNGSIISGTGGSVEWDFHHYTLHRGKKRCAVHFLQIFFLAVINEEDHDFREEGFECGVFFPLPLVPKEHFA